MLLLKAFFVALALAGGNRRSRRSRRSGGGNGGSSNPCRELQDSDFEAFLGGDEGLLTTLQTGTMYCTLDARFEAWPGCPVETVEEETGGEEGTGDDGLRRNLKRGGGWGRKRYNKARFVMTQGTSSWMQVENKETDEYMCYEGDELQFVLESAVMDTTDEETGDSGLPRRWLRRGPTVTATVTMTQTSTADAVCTLSHVLTCSIPHYGLTAVDETTCSGTSFSCETQEEDSDTRIKMSCYTSEEDAFKRWESADACPAEADEGTGEEEGTGEGETDGEEPTVLSP